MIFINLERFSKNDQILDFMKIRPVGAELSHADRDMTKLIAGFHNSAKSPKINQLHYETSKK